MNDQFAESTLDVEMLDVPDVPTVREAASTAVVRERVENKVSAYRKLLEDLEMWPDTQALWQRAYAEKKTYNGADKQELDAQFQAVKGKRREHVLAGIEDWSKNVTDGQAKSNVLARMYTYSQNHGEDALLNASIGLQKAREKEEAERR